MHSTREPFWIHLNTLWLLIVFISLYDLGVCTLNMYADMLTFQSMNCALRPCREKSNHVRFLCFWALLIWSYQPCAVFTQRFVIDCFVFASLELDQTGIGFCSCFFFNLCYFMQASAAVQAQVASFLGSNDDIVIVGGESMVTLMLL